MKKFLILAVSAILSLSCFTACNFNEAVIMAGVEIANADCPEDLGDGLTLTKVSYENHYIVYEASCSPFEYSMDDFRSGYSIVKNALLQEWRSNLRYDEDVKELFKAMKAEEVGIIYRYSIAGEGSIDVVLEYYEL